MFTKGLNLILLISIFALSCKSKKQNDSTPPIVQEEELLPAPVSNDQVVEVEEEIPAEEVMVEVTPLQSENFEFSLTVDLILGIAADGNVEEMVAGLIANFETLLSNLAASKIDLNLHLLDNELLTIPASIDSSKFARLDVSLEGTNAIGHISHLLEGDYAELYLDAEGEALPAPLAFRPNAKLEAIIISSDNGDGAIEDGKSNLAADFDPDKKWNITFTSIVGLPTSPNGTEPCEIDNVGTEYIEIANKSAGSVIDICSADWNQVMIGLATSMMQRLTTFKLKSKPTNAASLMIKIDGKGVDGADWKYDAEKNSVHLLNPALLVNGAKIEVIYP